MGVGWKLMSGPITICKAESSLLEIGMWWQWRDQSAGLETVMHLKVFHSVFPMRLVVLSRRESLRRCK